MAPVYEWPWPERTWLRGRGCRNRRGVAGVYAPRCPRIRLYTTQWCGYCVRARMLLEARGLAFEEVSLDDDPAFRQTRLRPGPAVDRAARDDRRRAYRRLRRARGPRPLGPPGRAARCVDERLLAARTVARARSTPLAPASSRQCLAAGQNVVARPPTTMRTSGVPQRSHGSPPAPVGAELVLHRAVGAVGKRVVAQCRALARDPLRRTPRTARCSRRELVVVEAACHPEWMQHARHSASST